MKKYLLYLLITFSSPLFTGCGDDDIVFDSSTILKVSSSTDSLIADDYSTCLIIIELDSRLSDRSGKQVSFTTNLGSFPYGADVYTDADGKAAVYFKSDKQGVATIQAKLGEFVNSKNVVLTEAWPDRLLISSDSTTMHNVLNNSITMKANAVRTFGSPTAGLAITWRAFDSTGVTKGTFVNATYTNDDNEATAEFHMLDTTYTGMLFYIGTAITGSSTIVSDTNRVFIVD